MAFWLQSPNMKALLAESFRELLTRLGYGTADYDPCAQGVMTPIIPSLPDLPSSIYDEISTEWPFEPMDAATKPGVDGVLASGGEDAIMNRCHCIDPQLTLLKLAIVSGGSENVLFGQDESGGWTTSNGGRGERIPAGRQGRRRLGT